MKRTREAELGLSILSSFPNVVASRLMKAAEREQDWIRLVNYLSGDFEPKITFTAKLDGSEDDQLPAKAWWVRFGDYALVWSEGFLFRDMEGGSPDPLQRKYLWIDLKGEREIEKVVSDLHHNNGNGRDYDIFRVDWVTPHLAGLPRDLSSRVNCDFLYDEELHTYKLMEVSTVEQIKEEWVIRHYHPLFLIRVLVEETLHSEVKGQGEDHEFLKFVQAVSRSSDKKIEKYQRYAERLLAFWTERKGSTTQI